MRTKSFEASQTGMFSWGAVGKVPEHVLGDSIDTVRDLYARKLPPFENLKIQRRRKDIG